MVRKLFVSVMAGVMAAMMTAQPAAADGHSETGANAARPLIIAHRGSSGERPEHTLAAYELAIDQGADYIEPDLVVTKDLVLVSRHENELSGTTDVASREEFETRRRTKTIDGRQVAGWFAEDFTLAELRTLRARERVGNIRPASAAYNGLYQVPTFEEIVQLVRLKEAQTGRAIGLYPELKHPTAILEQEGIDMVDLVIRELRRLGLDGADARVFLQVFEVGPLQRLNQRIDTPLVLLINAQNGPYDEPEMRWADMITPTGLAEIAEYADGIGPWLGHPWTLRKENGFLPASLQNDGGPAAEGQYERLWSAAIASGADGFFTDNVAELVELMGE